MDQTRRKFLLSMGLLGIHSMVGEERKPGSASELPGNAGWSRLPDLPGIEGVAGPFVGAAGERLVVAGGTNFRGGRPWNGGRKIWHDTIWTYRLGDDAWTVAGRLPCSLAYGLSISTRGALWCIGGGDVEKNFSNVWLLRDQNGSLRCLSGPSLPRPLANHAGALIGTRIYIAGGQFKPEDDRAERLFWALDLDNLVDGWKEMPPWDGPGRSMAVAGALGNDFFLCGGYEPFRDSDGRIGRRFLKDGYRYDPESGWTRLADLPIEASAVPSPALNLDPSRLVLLGWNDGSRAGQFPPETRANFPTDLLMYDASTDKWIIQGNAPFEAKVTPVAKWLDRVVVASGELQPGVRSAQVWSIEVADISRWYAATCRADGKTAALERN